MAPTLAMMELWVRLFALIVGPVCTFYLIYWDLVRNDTTVTNTRMMVAILAVASSAILFTDSLYVYEYGRGFGWGLFAISAGLAVRLVNVVQIQQGKHHSKNKKHVTKRKATLFTIIIWGLIAITSIVFLRSDGGHAMASYLQSIPHLSGFFGFVAAGTASKGQYHPLYQVSDPGIDLPTIEPGFYHSDNPLIQSITRHWPESSRSYNISTGATPYLVNGDQRTGIPFLVNKVEEQEYIRVHVRNPFDNESISLDIAFPYSDDVMKTNDPQRQYVHHLGKPVYLILHGLNGGSHEEYVKDFVLRRRSEGSTVVVMIARGMMNTSMKGWNVFHGARTGDVDVTARAVKRGLDEMAKAYSVDRQIFTGVGYSMGGEDLSSDLWLLVLPASNLIPLLYALYPFFLQPSFSLTT